jgi:hypothetical protein
VVAGIVAGALLAAGLLYAVLLGPGLRFPDEGEYLRLAGNLVAGGGYSLDGVHPTAFRPPGYPTVLAPVVALGGGAVVARALNYVLLAGAVGVVFLVLRRAGHRLAAALTPVFVAAYPVVFYTAGTLYPQTLALFGVALLVLLLEPARPSVAAGAGAGLLSAALALTVPTLVFLLPVAVGWLALRARGGRRIVVAGACLAAGLVPLGAWAARNEAALGAPVLLSTNSGYNLLLGNAERTTPNAGVNADVRREIAPAAPLGEVARDDYLRGRALAWVSGHPGRAARLYVLKVLNYFNYRNDLRTGGRSSALADLAVGVTYGTLLALVIVRLALARRRPLSALEGLLLGIYLLAALATAVAFTRIRFRVPFDPLLAALAALAVEAWCRGRARPPGAGSAVTDRGDADPGAAAAPP